MANVGFCSGCAGRVLLDETGACSHGHGPSCVTDVVELGDAEEPAPAWATQPRREPERADDHPLVDSMLQGLRHSDDVDLAKRYRAGGTTIRALYVILVIAIFGSCILYSGYVVRQGAMSAQARAEQAMQRAQKEYLRAPRGVTGPTDHAFADESVCREQVAMVMSAVTMDAYRTGQDRGPSVTQVMAALGRAHIKCPGGGQYTVDSHGEVVCSVHR